MSEDCHARVVKRVTGLFDVPVIQNNLRGMYVEFLVAELLGNDWRHNGSDWAAYDFEHATGIRVEVKQSAARQTWSTPGASLSSRSFSIRAPKLEWVGNVSYESNTRPASIYIFAWHEVLSDLADHRNAKQWAFFVVPTRCLPAQKTISLSVLRKLAHPVPANQLKPTVEALLSEGIS